MDNYLINQLIKALFAALSPTMLEEFADKILDFAENKAATMADGPRKTIIMNACASVRAAFQIEDND